MVVTVESTRVECGGSGGSCTTHDKRTGTKRMQCMKGAGAWGGE